jgi:hypothetical protein
MRWEQAAPLQRCWGRPGALHPLPLRRHSQRRVRGEAGQVPQPLRLHRPPRPRLALVLITEPPSSATTTSEGAAAREGAWEAAHPPHRGRCYCKALLLICIGWRLLGLAAAAVAASGRGSGQGRGLAFINCKLCTARVTLEHLNTGACCCKRMTCCRPRDACTRVRCFPGPRRRRLEWG